MSADVGEGGSGAEGDGAGVHLDEAEFPQVIDGEQVLRGEVADMHVCDGIAAWHWWTLAEMDSTDEVIWPEGLADLVRGVLSR